MHATVLHIVVKLVAGVKVVGHNVRKWPALPLLRRFSPAFNEAGSRMSRRDSLRCIAVDSVDSRFGLAYVAVVIEVMSC